MNEKGWKMNRKKVVFYTVLTLVFVMVPMLAYAAEGAAPADAAANSSSNVQVAKYISAGVVMAVSALSAAFAQAKIGAAAAGTIAERPEAATMLIVLQALPEIIVLLGFVTALIITG